MTIKIDSDILQLIAASLEPQITTYGASATINALSIACHNLSDDARMVQDEAARVSLRDLGNALYRVLA